MLFLQIISQIRTEQPFFLIIVTLTLAQGHKRRCVLAVNEKVIGFSNMPHYFGSEMLGVRLQSYLGNIRSKTRSKIVLTLTFEDRIEWNLIHT